MSCGLQAKIKLFYTQSAEHCTLCVQSMLCTESLPNNLVELQKYLNSTARENTQLKSQIGKLEVAVESLSKTKLEMHGIGRRKLATRSPTCRNSRNSMRFKMCNKQVTNVTCLASLLQETKMLKLTIKYLLEENDALMLIRKKSMEAVLNLRAILVCK